MVVEFSFYFLFSGGCGFFMVVGVVGFMTNVVVGGNRGGG